MANGQTHRQNNKVKSLTDILNALINIQKFICKFAR